LQIITGHCFFPGLALLYIRTYIRTAARSWQKINIAAAAAAGAVKSDDTSDIKLSNYFISLVYTYKLHTYVVLSL
jgi:hypothetical protein